MSPCVCFVSRRSHTFPLALPCFPWRRLPPAQRAQIIIIIMQLCHTPSHNSRARSQSEPNETRTPQHDTRLGCAAVASGSRNNGWLAGPGLSVMDGETQTRNVNARWMAGWLARFSERNVDSVLINIDNE